MKIETNMNKIGNTIRIMRELANLKQNEFAESLGVSPNYISLIENGKKEPSLKLLKKISHKFDIPISVLLWEDPPINKKTAKEDVQTAKEISNLFWDLVKLRFQKRG